MREISQVVIFVVVIHVLLVVTELVDDLVPERGAEAAAGGVVGADLALPRARAAAGRRADPGAGPRHGLLLRGQLLPCSW